MRKERKHYTAEKKVAILRRHLLDKMLVSDLCEELGLPPTVILPVAKEILLRMVLPPSRARAVPDQQAEQQRIEFLEKKIQTKDEVLAELMAEHIAQKKGLGSSDQKCGFARRAGPGGGFRPVLVGKNRDRRRTIHPLAGKYGPASFTTGRSAMGASTSTTAGFPAISGSRRGRSRPSSVSMEHPWKAIDD